VSPARPTLTVGVTTYGHWLEDFRQLLDLARAAEGAGMHRFVVSDHVILGPDIGSYPWGQFPADHDWPWPEPLTVLASMAAVTTTIRLQTGIVVAPLRGPALLAKTVATVDVMSGGRLDLGVGTGWHEHEYTAQGLDFSQRGDRLTESVAACRAMWSVAPATYTWNGANVADVWCLPRPAQERLPVWFAGSMTDRNVARMVQLGDGWLPIMRSTSDDVRSGVDRLALSASAAGRTVDEFVVQVPIPIRIGDHGFDLERSISDAVPYWKAGGTDFHLPLRVLCDDVRKMPVALARLRDVFDREMQ
jgi:probable F420-dependent oxidoreductase